MEGKIPWWPEHDRRHQAKAKRMAEYQARQPFFRRMLYHESAPKGRVFEDEAEYADAVKDGWLDRPLDYPEPENAKPTKATNKRKKGK